jgi:hypothetical protein
LVNSIRQGAYIETAAAYAGIHKSTLYDWLKRGTRSKSGIYRSFSDTVGQAMAESELKSLRQIDEAANFNWQAVAWKLERRFPRRWGRKKYIASEVRAEVRHLREEARRVMRDPKAKELAITRFERVAETRLLLHKLASSLGSLTHRQARQVRASTESLFWDDVPVYDS